jgi:hypothetical protein
MKVTEIKGFKSLKAMNAFHSLMLGLKMMPSYMSESYESFFAKIDAMPPEDQEKMIREAVLFVELQKDEVEAMASFCVDANGVSYSAQNMNNLSPTDLIEIIVAVCKEISKIKINFVSEAEKKKLKTSQ